MSKILVFIIENSESILLLSCALCIIYCSIEMTAKYRKERKERKKKMKLESEKKSLAEEFKNIDIDDNKIFAEEDETEMCPDEIDLISMEMADTNKKEEKYLEELPKVEKITVLQFQRLLRPLMDITIRPNLHKTYYRGNCVYIPKDLYNLRVNDISFHKFSHGETQLELYVEEDETYERISDFKELMDINNHYKYGE